MKRPFVVCHVLSSADGKLDGNFFFSSYVYDARYEYARVRKEYDCDGAVYGSVSMAETYASGFIDLKGKRPERHEDYIADNKCGQYFISIDKEGTVAYENSHVEKRGNPRAHFIEAVTGMVSEEYLNYLRKTGVSYIFAGAEEIDLKILLDKLYRLFDIRRVMIAGGGKTDYSFLKEGLVDEISIIIAPVVEPVSAAVSIFEPMFEEKEAPVDLKLLDVKKVLNDCVHLKYAPVYREKYERKKD